MAVEPLRILLVDDNPDDLQLITRRLEREFPSVEVQRANTPEDFDRALGEGQFDLAITDFQLQWTDGLSVLRAIKQRFPYRPVIMFTATGSQEVAVEAMKSGLDDYILKSVKHFARLASAVRKSLLYTEAQRRAAELQVRLNSLLTRLNIGVYRIHISGKLLDCNPAFLRLIGAQTLDEAQTIYDAHFAHSSEEMPIAGQPVAREIDLPVGDDRHCLLVEEVLSAAPNRDRLVEGVVQDSTERKRTERQLRDLLRVKDEFLSTVSHELRTPLNLISGWAHLLMNDSIDENSRKKALDTIIRSVRAQAQIIDDLMDASAIITGKLRLQMQEVDVSELLEKVLESLRPTAQSKKVSLDEPRRSEHPLHMQGDPTRLQQIMWNLLSNAIKFTDPGGHVSAELTHVDSQIVITVSDTGCGIQPDFLPYVFDRFSQADSSFSRNKGGLGLGLALVRHLVELHGGTVQAASNGPDCGATFTVRLPTGILRKHDAA
jgi:signal transduction histidine kinase